MTGETLVSRVCDLTSLLEVGAPEALALVSPGARQIAYRDLAAEVDALATGLRTLGVRPGDRVAYVLPNGPETIEVILAVASLGAAAAPLNPALTESELSFYLGEIVPGHLLLSADQFAAARAAAPAGTELVDVVVHPSGPPTLSRCGKPGGSPSRARGGSPEDVALLLHTSGTTSRPKQVPLLHRNLVASAKTIARHYELSPGDVSYCAMPLFHVHGLVASVLATLASGGTVVVPRRVGPSRFWGDLAKYGPSWFTAAPTVLEMLLDGAPDGRPGRSDLRFARTCSAPLRSDLHSRAEDELGVPVLEAYGMTEASHQITSNPLGPGERRPGSVGVPTGTEVHVLDVGGLELPEDMSGEVAIRGPGIMPGYCDPGANAESFLDGWFRTGDIGRIVEGALWLEGRLKELIIRGGENVSPYEVEAVLLDHAAVADALCFGLPSKKYGEEVAAAVRLAADVDEKELIAHCREQLAAYKVPKMVRVVESIPRTATGKPQRNVLAASTAAELGL